MSEIGRRGRVWLNVDVPKPVAAQFAAYAAAQHRNSRQQLRALVEHFANEQARAERANERTAA